MPSQISYYSPNTVLTALEYTQVLDAIINMIEWYILSNNAYTYAI